MDKVQTIIKSQQTFHMIIINLESTITILTHLQTSQAS